MQGAMTTAADRQLQDTVARLSQVIAEENAALRDNKTHNLDSIIQKKSQLLLELMRLQKSLGSVDRADGNRAILARIKKELANNERLLGIHLAAARDISDTILEALRQGESDGTYGGGANAYYGRP